MSSDANELDRLRASLDDLDRRLVEIAAQRTDTAQRIARAKAMMTPGGKPLFDRERERAVYERARKNADAVGLEPHVAQRLMGVLIERSHEIQEAMAQETSRVAVAGRETRFLVVGGGGRMGRRLGAALTERGHAIDVLERDDGRDAAEAVRAAEIVVLAVPMEAVVDVAEQLGPHVAEDALLCDINSLKGDVCGAMAGACRGEVLGLHPMFGPTVHSLRRQKVVVCPVRPGDRSAWLCRELGAMGMEVIESDAETHDRMMAVVQVLVHFSTLVMGEALRSTGVSVADSLRYTSPIYRLELAFVGRLFAQNPELYAEIEMTNPNGAAVRGHFLEAARTLEGIVNAGDRAAFEEHFGRVADYFASFGGEAMELSDDIIDTVVRRP